MYQTFTNKSDVPLRYVNNILRIMKLTTLLLLVGMLQLSAASYGQRITLSEKQVSISKIFKKITEQSGVGFFVNDRTIKDAKPVSIEVKNAELIDVLNLIFKDQPFNFKVDGKVIMVSKKEAPSFLDKVVDAFTPPVDVRGIVLDEKGQPLVGATVKVKGNSQTTTTDAQGKFFLRGVDDKAVLVISFIGYAHKEVAAKASISVSLEVQSAELQEVNVAYGRQTQRSLTGAITVVSGKGIEAMPNRSFDRSLQGLVPGLLVTNGNGQPGGGVSNFVLRGISTAASPFGGSTARNPLIVVDGIPVSQDNFQLFATPTGITPIVSNPLAQLNPSDIETLTVLKDAAAIALYGARASNGVIVVTTKKGKSGQTLFNFRTQADVATRIDGNQKLLNTDQYIELLYETYRNSNPVTYSTDQAIFNVLTKPQGSVPALFLTRADGSFYPATDWLGALFDNHAITLTNELSVSGGTEKSNFYLNLEYTKQDGVVKKTGYDRKSLRFNFDNRPNRWLKLGVNSTFSYNVQDYGVGLRSSSGIANAAVSPLNPIRYENGDYVFNHNAGGGTGTATEYANPVTQAEFNLNRNTGFRGLTKVYAEINFLKNFRFTTNVGADFMLAEAKEKSDPRMVDNGNFASGVGRIEEQDLRRANLITTNIFNYNKTINEQHTISALAGQEAQILSQRNLLLAVRNLSLPYYDQISSPGVLVFRNSGFNTKETLLSYFGQINYDYKNKYYFTSSIRRDGSSRFGDDKRYGTYWSTGLGWVLSNEPFLKASWLDYLKLRGSIGAAGNAAAINAQTRYDQLVSTLFLGSTAVSPTTIPGSTEVHWEKTFTWDAGIEARLFGNRISITADIYKKYTSDLIYNVPLPQTSGYYQVLQNIGDIENRGLELSLNTELLKNNSFSWTMSANWSTNHNKLIKANGPNSTIVSTTIANKEGEDFNSFFLVKWAGVDPETGSAQYYDINGNKTTTYSDNDKVFSGKPAPDGFGALTNRFSYLSLDLSFMLYYQYGNHIYIADDLVNDGLYPYLNQSVRALDRWQTKGDISSNPKRVLSNSSGRRASTRNLYDGDYLRLQNVTLGYSLPDQLTRRINIKKARIFIQGNNLALWSKFPGDDPGNANVVGSSTAQYPNSRSFSIGLNANF